MCFLARNLVKHLLVQALPHVGKHVLFDVLGEGAVGRELGA
jgi:hypothetical protein